MRNRHGSGWSCVLWVCLILSIRSLCLKVAVEAVSVQSLVPARVSVVKLPAMLTLLSKHSYLFASHLFGLVVCNRYWKVLIHVTCSDSLEKRFWWAGSDGLVLIDAGLEPVPEIYDSSHHYSKLGESGLILKECSGNKRLSPTSFTQTLHMTTVSVVITMRRLSVTTHMMVLDQSCRQ